ncbi:GGDEF domain-containing protein [Pseudoduganella violacea]|uniref:diguanylate cyclase n=1 Tax=Pseudoduganella violacea TaxID=1715466 RepID=A0A7W5B701_9BURK|nr:GGDEF domain-containing protein [Pseudoduganella violacea]MBB3117688.1 diguanylate cyclase (GGDEF)-like protein [Pseudoduganella violacea]
MNGTGRLPLLEGVLAAVDLGIIVLDGARRVVLWNQWMSRHSGTAAAAVLGQDFATLFPELRGRRVDAAITQALEHNFPSLLSQTLNRSPFALFANASAAQREERLQQALAVTPLAVDGAPRHCMIEIHDVSIAVGREKLLRQQALELRSQSFSDGLTGVANRRHFDVAIDKELRRAKRNGSALSLLMIDIDHFKNFNDHYGHQRGDECLVRVASALSGMLQRAADLIARYGGEEFVLILPDTNAEQAAHMAEALRARVIALHIPHAASGVELKQVTVSIGVATRTLAHPAEAQELIGAADRALYEAKRGGRNRIATQAPA